MAQNLQALEQAVRNEQPNNHEKHAENSAALIVQRLHTRYFPDRTEEKMYEGVTDLVTYWVDELFHHKILTRDSEQALQFLENLKRLVTYRHDQWDMVILNEKQEKCHLWEVFWCVTQALRDGKRYDNPAFPYRERLFCLYSTLTSALKSNAGLDGGFCNTGVRNDMVSVLNHEYIDDDGEKIYVFTSIRAAISNQIERFYEKKLSTFINSENPADRQLGFRIMRQWLNQQFSRPNTSTCELEDFQNVRAELKTTIEDFIEAKTAISRQSPSVMNPLNEIWTYLDFWGCPQIKSHRQASLALAEVTQHPEFYSEDIVRSVESCQCLEEVASIIGPVKRTQLHRKISQYSRMLAIGEFEGRLKVLASRIQTDLEAITSDDDPEACLRKVEKLDDEFSDMLKTVSRESNTDTLRESFAMLAGLVHEDLIALFHSFIVRPEFTISEVELRQTLESLAHEEDGYTVLDLTPVTVNKILWFAIRTSMAEWSADFQYIIRLLVLEFKKGSHDRNTTLWRQTSYPDELINQLEWMLACAADKKWRQPPGPLFTSCNARGLEVPEGTFSDSHSVNNHLMVPLVSNGWWIGLPGILSLGDLPLTIGQLKIIWRKCTLTQILREFELGLPGFKRRFAQGGLFDVNGIMGVYQSLPPEALVEVIIKYWDTLPRAQRINLLRQQLDGSDWSTEVFNRINSKISTFQDFMDFWQILDNRKFQTQLVQSHLDLFQSQENRSVFFATKSADYNIFTLILEHVLDVTQNPEDYVSTVHKAFKEGVRAIIPAIRLKKLLALCPENENAFLYLRQVNELKLLDLDLNDNRIQMNEVKRILTPDAIRKLNQEQVRLYHKIQELIKEFDICPIDEKEKQYVDSLDGLNQLKAMLKQNEFDAQAIEKCESRCRKARKAFERSEKVQKLLRSTLTYRPACYRGHFMHSDTTLDDYSRMVQAFHKTRKLNENDITDIKRRVAPWVGMEFLLDECGPFESKPNPALSRYAVQCIVVYAFSMNPRAWSWNLIDVLHTVIKAPTPWLSDVNRKLLVDQIQLLLEVKEHGRRTTDLLIPLILPCRLDNHSIHKGDSKKSAERENEVYRANLTYYFDWVDMPFYMSHMIPSLLEKSPVPLFLALERAQPQERIVIVKNYFQYTDKSLSVVEAIKNRLPKSDHDTFDLLCLELANPSKEVKNV